MASALWLGILTSISPCPLATNIAAISFIGRRVDSPRKVFAAGLLYTAGRSVAYVLVGGLLVFGLTSAPLLSQLLQKQMNRVLGPILIIAGMFLLELLKVNMGGGVSEKMQRRVEAMGLWGAALMGIVFAMSFCPVSAALFFGSLIPVAVKYESAALLPSLYGIGTALPVVVFAVLLAFGVRSIGKAFGAITRFELWARRVTGAVFIIVGIYLTLLHIFGVFA